VAAWTWYRFNVLCSKSWWSVASCW